MLQGSEKHGSHGKKGFFDKGDFNSHKGGFHKSFGGKGSHGHKSSHGKSGGHKGGHKSSHHHH